jgi:hypothetical protein
MIYFSASPVSSLFQLNDEEYSKMAEYTLSTGLPYKGKDFLEWRYGWLGVYFWVSVTGFAIVLAGTILGVRRLWIDSGVEQRKQLADIFKLKHARAET